LSHLRPQSAFCHLPTCLTPDPWPPSCYRWLCNKLSSIKLALVWSQALWSSHHMRLKWLSLSGLLSPANTFKAFLRNPRNRGNIFRLSGLLSPAISLKWAFALDWNAPVESSNCISCLYLGPLIYCLSGCWSVRLINGLSRWPGFLSLFGCLFGIL